MQSSITVSLLHEAIFVNKKTVFVIYFYINIVRFAQIYYVKSIKLYNFTLQTKNSLTKCFFCGIIYITIFIFVINY